MIFRTYVKQWMCPTLPCTNFTRDSEVGFVKAIRHKEALHYKKDKWFFDLYLDAINYTHVTIIKKRELYIPDNIEWTILYIHTSLICSTKQPQFEIIPDTRSA